MVSVEERSPLAHQFDDLAQQRDADELGMWIFLATEVLFFGVLFLTYAVYRYWYEDAFAAASHHSNLLLGTINTGVILTSSLFMALAVRAAHDGQRKALIASLVATIVFGVAFLGIKFVEYAQDYYEHLIPLFGLPFDYNGPEPGQAQIYFNLYFLMTGAHAVHMIIGLGALSILLGLALRGRLLADHSTPVHVTGLYWHFVDIVWVYLYPLLYLIGARWS